MADRQAQTESSGERAITEQSCSSWIGLMKHYPVYILKCADDSYYVGVTNDIESRFAQHNSGLNNKAYTYSRRPVALMFQDVNQAIAFEKQVKGWRRAKKEALINQEWDRLPELSKAYNRRDDVIRFSRLCLYDGSPNYVVFFDVNSTSGIATCSQCRCHPEPASPAGPSKGVRKSILTSLRQAQTDRFNPKITL